MAGALKEVDLPLLYNGLVETAMRSLVILDAAFPVSFTLDELRLLEFFVVFGDDVGAPGGSLHVLLPGRHRAHSFRGAAIQSGLALLSAIGTVDGTEKNGVTEYAGDGEAVSASGWLSSDYLTRMYAVAKWMRGQIDEYGKAAFIARLERRLLDLSANELDIPAPQRERFDSLAAVYESDLLRLEGLSEAAWILRWFGNVRRKEINGPLPDGIPSDEWYEGVRVSAVRELASVVSKKAGLAEVIETLP